MIVAFCAVNFLLTGMPIPLFQIESLHKPAKIVEIRKDGLLTADGRLLAIKHVSEVSSNLEVLKDAVKKGVEIDPDGYLIGLLKIHHWCGNDPVRYHIGRVNLSWLLALMGTKMNVGLPDYMQKRCGHASYGPRGLRVGDWLQTHSLEREWKLLQDKSALSDKRTDARSAAALTLEQATALARRLANERAQARYQCQPFRGGPSARHEGECWTWSDRKGYGQGDIETKVFFDINGSAPKVEVYLLDSQGGDGRIFRELDSSDGCLGTMRSLPLGR